MRPDPGGSVQSVETPLDRQIQESVNIEERSLRPRECLNLKSEWAGSKHPGLTIQRPKGVMREKDRDKKGQGGEGGWSETGAETGTDSVVDRVTAWGTGDRRGSKRDRGCTRQNVATQLRGQCNRQGVAADTETRRL